MTVIYHERGTYKLSFEGSTNFSRQKLGKLCRFSCWPSKTLIFDDVIAKMWWRHRGNNNPIYNFLLLAWSTTTLPSLVAFGVIFRKFIGEVNLPPPRPTYMIDIPRNRVKGEVRSIFWRWVCVLHNQEKTFVFTIMTYLVASLSSKWWW